MAEDYDDEAVDGEDGPDLDEAVLVEDLDAVDDVIDDVLDAADDVIGAVVDDEEVEAVDDEEMDLEEEQHPDDIEEPLDILLAERTSGTSRAADADDEQEPDDDDGDGDGDERGDTISRIQPKRPGEFVCRSCFLVKHPSQLADKKKQLCRDCV